MVALNGLRGCLPIFIMVFSTFSVHAVDMESEKLILEEPPAKTMVEHHDVIEVDPTLNLSKVVSLTLEKYPDALWLKALEDEVLALKARSQSLFSEAAILNLAFQEATSGTLHYGDAKVQVSLWNVGQKRAESLVAKYAANNALDQVDAIKLKIAGLVRNSLWDITLANLSYEQSQIELAMTKQLFAKVQRRVALGDLPRSDELLAKTEVLQKKSALTMAEAELMHARKRYTTITQTTKIPATYLEKLCNLTTVKQNHAALVAVNAQIERKHAELNATRLVGSGQTQLAIGINIDEGNDPRSNKTESFNIGVNVPFGGSAHLAPQLAMINVELNKLLADREQLIRELEQAHHEAEHNLEVNRVEMGIADELKRTAEEHLKMTQLSFSVGEIDLIDLLKIQTRTQQAVLNAKQRSVMIQRDIALYNQAVGVLP